MSDALTYLQGDAPGPKRDLIARYYYEVAQGDPNSSPVAFAVLLEASAEQFAKTPEELGRITADFRKLLTEGRGMEARIRERVELSNAGVIASLKEEGNRIAGNLQAASHQHSKMIGEAHQLVVFTQKVLDQGEILLTELRLIRAELIRNGEATKNVAVATENNKAISQSIEEVVSTLTIAAELNWMTIGVGIGFVLTIIAMQLALWLALLMFVLAIGLLQAAARGTLDAIRDKAATMKPSGQGK
jgi:hypothetical protein